MLPSTRSLAVATATLLLSSVVSGFVSTGRLLGSNNPQSSSSTLLRDSGEDVNAPLSLSASDMKRLTAVRTRHQTLPLMIMDALVPGQTISFQSADPRFHSLIHYVLSEGTDIGLVGLNPHTGNPLNVGVTLPVKPEDVVVNKKTKVVSLTLQAKNRFEVQGEPWLLDDDPTITKHNDEDNEDAAFYLADVETVDSRKEDPMTDEAAATTQNLADQLPTLIGTWVHHLVANNRADALKMESRMMELGPLPSDWTEQALWVAALLNPSTSHTASDEERVCLEIRPAMLSCKNDHDRMLLATAALQSSIDHVSGKNKLF